MSLSTHTSNCVSTERMLTHNGKRIEEDEEIRRLFSELSECTSYIVTSADFSDLEDDYSSKDLSEVSDYCCEDTLVFPEEDTLPELEEPELEDVQSVKRKLFSVNIFSMEVPKVIYNPKCLVNSEVDLETIINKLFEKKN